MAGHTYSDRVVMGVLGCATCVSFMFVSASNVNHHYNSGGSRLPSR